MGRKSLVSHLRSMHAPFRRRKREREGGSHQLSQALASPSSTLPLLAPLSHPLHHGSLPLETPRHKDIPARAPLSARPPHQRPRCLGPRPQTRRQAPKGTSPSLSLSLSCSVVLITLTTPAAQERRRRHVVRPERSPGPRRPRRPRRRGPRKGRRRRVRHLLRRRRRLRLPAAPPPGRRWRLRRRGLPRRGARAEQAAQGQGQGQGGGGGRSGVPAE